MSHRLTWPRALAIALAIAAGLGLFGVTVATADFNYDAPAHVVAPPERVAPVASPSTTATPNARIVALVARPAPTGVRRASTSSSSLSRAAKGATKLVEGARYPLSPKIQGQLAKRGWTTEAIDDAVQSGKQVRAVNKATGNPATRYVHLNTGQSVVIDDVTGQVIHVGGPGFKYGPDGGDVP